MDARTGEAPIRELGNCGIEDFLLRRISVPGHGPHHNSNRLFAFAKQHAVASIPTGRLEIEWNTRVKR
jgi:hypothetical protein